MIMIDFSKVDRNEVYRYMGNGASEPDNKLKAITEDIIKELAENISPAYIIRETGIEIEGIVVSLDFCKVSSKALSEHLKGTEKGYILAATIGSEADRIISKYSILSPVKAIAAQAAAAAMIEEYADAVCKKIQNETGLYPKPRFSPGYGDFPLDFQKTILDALEAPKRIGLCLTDGGLLTPVKSITAVVGMTENAECHADKCKSCPNMNCTFRR